MKKHLMSMRIRYPHESVLCQFLWWWWLPVALMSFQSANSVLNLPLFEMEICPIFTFMAFIQHEEEILTLKIFTFQLIDGLASFFSNLEHHAELLICKTWDFFHNSWDVCILSFHSILNLLYNFSSGKCKANTKVFPQEKVERVECCWEC